MSMGIGMGNKIVNYGSFSRDYASGDGGRLSIRKIAVENIPEKTLRYSKSLYGSYRTAHN